MIRPLALLALTTLAVAGCGSKAPLSSDGKSPDPYAGMTKEQKIQAIRDDPKINGMQKETMIADAQKGG